MKQKVLILSPYLPWPLSTGGNVGVFHMLSYISDKMDVSFISTYDKRSNNYKSLKILEKRLPNVQFNLYDYRKSNNRIYEYYRKIIRRFNLKIKFGNEISLDTLNVLIAVTPGFISYINDYISEKKIDIIQVEFYGFHSLVYALPLNIKKIFIHHELRFVRNTLLYGNDVYSNFVKEYLKDSEMSIINRFDVVGALSEVDKQKMKEAGITTRIAISTLAVSDVTLAYKEQKFNGALSFIGGSNHYPNVDGIMWFVEMVLPKIQKKMPQIRFNIIGKWSTADRDRVCRINSSVNFLGYVDQLGDAISNTIMVVPINIGSGIRMKILEAANFSVPFVATNIGAEGLNFRDGVDCFISKNAEEMVSNILRLCGDELLYCTFSKQVHLNFEKNYSIESLGEKRLELYE